MTGYEWVLVILTAAIVGLYAGYGWESRRVRRRADLWRQLPATKAGGSGGPGQVDITIVSMERYPFYPGEES